MNRMNFLSGIDQANQESPRYRTERLYSAVLDSRTRVQTLPIGVRWLLFMIFWCTLTAIGNCLIGCLIAFRPHLA